MGFRIGRALASHFYPESPRGGGAPTLFARNFATGPTSTTPIVGGVGTPIPWEIIDSGAPAGVDVPITPKSTGIIRITTVVVIQNASNDPAVPGTVQILAQIGGVTVAVPIAAQFSVDINQFKSIQIVAETPAQPIGVPVNVNIIATLIDGGPLSIFSESSTVEAQEVSAATG